MLRTFMFIFFVHISQVGWSIIPYFWDWGLGCKGQEAKNLSVRRWMRKGMGWMFRELCWWEVGVRLGWLPMTQEHVSVTLFAWQPVRIPNFQ
jgi:hypothetical protein